MSRGTDEGNYYHAKVQKEIPIKWTAPEAIIYRKWGPPSDVWSFGKFFFENFSCSQH
jgi:hypothetical protein